MPTTDLLLHGVTTDVDVHIQLVFTQDILQLMDIVIHGGHNRHNQNLARTNPKRPLATKVFDNNTEETFEATNDRTMDDDRTGTTRSKLLVLTFLRLTPLVGHVLELEVKGCLVIQLNGGTLEFSLESISNGDIDLGTIESAIALIDDPVVALEFCHCCFQLLLSVVPCLNFTKILLRASRKLQLECEAEQAINGLQEVEQPLNFRRDLRIVSFDLIL